MPSTVMYVVVNGVDVRMYETGVAVIVLVATVTVVGGPKEVV